MYVTSVGNLPPPASGPEPPHPAHSTRTAPSPGAVDVPDPAELKEAVETANRMARSSGGSLQFSVDLETGKTLLRIVDTSTNQVIRQIPAEEMLVLARSINRLLGLLIEQQA